MVEGNVSSSVVVGDFKPFKKNTLREFELMQGDTKNCRRVDFPELGQFEIRSLK